MLSINPQTPGPLDTGAQSRAGSALCLFASPSRHNPDGIIAAVRYLGNSPERTAEHEANARLLAASYTLIDRTARFMGIDACELADAMLAADVSTFALACRGANPVGVEKLLAKRGIGRG